MLAGMLTADADVVAAQLVQYGAGVTVKAGALTRHYGQLLQTRVKAKASGRPGPRAITGDYRRSIGLKFTTHAGAHTAVVGTDAAQGRRLEAGFVGVDSLGRAYNQAPLPHFGPAMDEIAVPFQTAIRASLGA
jgi:hypothetical protein